MPNDKTTQSLADALRDAAMSLEAIANSSGNDLLLEVSQIRAYARNRAIVARAALALHDSAPSAEPVAIVRVNKEGYVSLSVQSPNQLARLARMDGQPVYASPVAVEGWRPIESAPRDGTRFLATVRVYNASESDDEKVGTFSHWDTHVVWCDDETGELNDEAYQGWGFDDYEYWMPLPAPPSAQAGGGSQTIATEELEGLRRDAERYRWLRPRLHSMDGSYGDGDNAACVIMFSWPEHIAVGAYTALDAAIDAAIKGEK